MSEHLLLGQLFDPAPSHQLRALYGRILNGFGGWSPSSRRAGYRVDRGPRREGQIDKNEQGFKVNPFRRAKYPVINAQFAPFFTAEDGYRNEE